MAIRELKNFRTGSLFTIAAKLRFELDWKMSEIWVGCPNLGQGART